MTLYERARAYVCVYMKQSVYKDVDSMHGDLTRRLDQQEALLTKLTLVVSDIKRWQVLGGAMAVGSAAPSVRSRGGRGGGTLNSMDDLVGDGESTVDDGELGGGDPFLNMPAIPVVRGGGSVWSASDNH